MRNQTIMASSAGETLLPAGGPFNPQEALLNTLFPGFSLFNATVSRYLKVDLTTYIHYILLLGIAVFLLQHSSEYIQSFVDTHLMSRADIRVDDEIYNIFMAWLVQQNFSKTSRRFVANTNANSRDFWVSRGSSKDGDDEDADEDATVGAGLTKNKKMYCTPSFGTHHFWYKGHLLFFKRTINSSQGGWLSASEREEISLSCLGRNPAIIKEILDECRMNFLARDADKTAIYRGTVKSGSPEPAWTRCMSRVSRPFSTVVLDESVKQSLVDDLADYLHPSTRRWYGNRGIPYRRGYLLHGPPGTGKSSLSFALAGYFKLKIYIVSLNSQLMTEENLGTLFSELPKHCVVLLEDIDTAGLTHTRDGDKAGDDEADDPPIPPPGPKGKPTPPPGGKVSLSALLNIIDGVASQEGRVLIMTTNHIEKLDEALIRPGRVDMMVKFHLASKEQLAQIFVGVFTVMEGDLPKKEKVVKSLAGAATPVNPKGRTELETVQSENTKAKQEQDTKTEQARILKLAEQFTAAIPSEKFSPAEIQGFLLKWKRNPEMAVKMAPAWVEEMRIKKEKAKAAAEQKTEEKIEEKEDGKVETNSTSSSGSSVGTSSSVGTPASTSSPGTPNSEVEDMGNDEVKVDAAGGDRD